MNKREIVAPIIVGAAVATVCYGIGTLIGHFIVGFTRLPKATKVWSCDVCYTTDTGVVIPCKDHSEGGWTEQDWEDAFNN